jgi:hypothetical protein
VCCFAGNLMSLFGSQLLPTPDGKFYVYCGRRELSNLFVVSGLK